MKIIVERTTFLSALGHVQNVVEKRNTIPVLANVLINAEKDFLKLTATDLDVGVVEKISAEVVTPGSITAPAHVLHEITRKLPDGAQIEIEQGADSGRLQIRSGKINFELQTLPVEDFPDFTAGELGYSFDMQASELRALIDKTSFAISTEETRYYLNGIYFHQIEDNEEKIIRAVATDGHRLAMSQIELPEGADGMPGVIIPRKTVNELRRLLDDESLAVNISLSDSKIKFIIGEIILISKLIDGNFPEYSNVIPKNNDKGMTVDIKLFSQAVDRVSTISSDKSRAVRLILSENSLTLAATNLDSGSAEDEITVEYKDTTMEIGFNSKYLLDIAGQVSSSEALFLFSDVNAPAIIKDKEDKNVLYVLMPMRV